MCCMQATDQSQNTLLTGYRCHKGGCKTAKSSIQLTATTIILHCEWKKNTVQVRWKHFTRLCSTGNTDQIFPEWVWVLYKIQQKQLVRLFPIHSVCTLHKQSKWTKSRQKYKNIHNEAATEELAELDMQMQSVVCSMTSNHLQLQPGLVLDVRHSLQRACLVYTCLPA